MFYHHISNKMQKTRSIRATSKVLNVSAMPSVYPTQPLPRGFPVLLGKTKAAPNIREQLASKHGQPRSLGHWDPKC
jgi:hypothetical protein